MAKWVNVSAIRYQNHPNDVRKGRDRVMEIWELLIDRAGLDKLDILLLPEYFLGSATPGNQVETVPGEGPVQNFLARKARQYNTYIAAGMERVDAAGRKFNSAVLFDRAGNVAGIYDKNFPTPGEMENHGVTPGEQPCVFDTDFGRIGVAICFDLNFPELFEYYRHQKVELGCFLSSMHGGAHLPALARDGRMYMASAVEWGISYIISPIGVILAKTMDNERIVSHRINLDVKMYHLSPPNFPFDLKRKYGDTVKMERADAEPWRLLRCDRDDMTAGDIMREFKVEELDETLDRTRRLRGERVSRKVGTA